jgi:hypothetical protein
MQADDARIGAAGASPGVDEQPPEIEMSPA